MARPGILWVLALALSGCGDPHDRAANDNALSPSDRANTTPQTKIPDPTQIKPGDPGGLPDDRTPVSEGVIDPKSGQGAGLVLQRYAALLEQGKFAEARALWSDTGKASGMTERQFIDRFADYAEIHTEIGAPGEPEGAAGSVYVDIPFRLYGKLKSGKPFNLIGSATLRRVNDVPGSTESQRQWHIQNVEQVSRL